MAGFIFGLAIGAIMIGGLSSARLRAIFVARKKLVRLIAVLLIVMPLPLLIFGLSAFPALSIDLVAEALAWLILLGLGLLMIPAAAERMPAQIAASKAALELAPPPFSLWSQVRAAIAAPFLHLGAFARIAGPWLLACWGLVAAPALAIGEVETVTRAQANWALYGLAATMLCTFVGIASVGFGWQRFVLRGELPRWLAFPGRQTWRYLWRLWLIGIMVGAAGKGAGWLTARLAATGLDADFIGPFLTIAATLLAVLIIGVTWALAFPAMADGHKPPPGWAPSLGRPVRALSLGLAATAAPFVIFGALILMSGSLMLVLLAGFVVLFAGVVACSEYLARAYQAYKPQIELTLRR